MKPKILVVNPHMNLFGGAERQIVELANYLTDKNYRVTIFTTYACPQFKSKLKDSRIFECGSEQNLASYCNSFSHKFDLVNPHNHPSELYFAYQLKNRIAWQANEPPGYVLEGNPINPQEREFVRRTVSKASVITSFEFARFRSIYGFDPVVNNPGIRYDFFAEDAPVRHNLNMKDNFVISQLGYFTFTKNQKKTIEIFAEVKKEIPEAKLVLIGYNGNETKYPYVQSVHDKITELDLWDDVIINDYMDGDENFRNIYKQTNVFLNPVKSQGSYATTLEAICAGVPTIVSDDFVASKIITDNKLGWVSSSDVEEYVNKIKYIYDNYEKCKEETIENAKWIKENLTWQKFGEGYERMIEEVLGN